MNNPDCSTLTIPEIIKLIDEAQATRDEAMEVSDNTAWVNADIRLGELFKLLADKAEGKS